MNVTFKPITHTGNYMHYQVYR